LGPYLENDAAVCEITRHKVRLVGFSWSTVVGVSDFESTDIYPFKCNKVPIIFFPISDTSETKTDTETTLPNMSLICVPSSTVPNFLSPNKLILSTKNGRRKKETMSTSRVMESVNSSNTWEGLQGHKMQRYNQ